MTTATDPHHPTVKWKLQNGVFYFRGIGERKWKPLFCKHLTTDRVKVLYEMVMLEEARRELQKLLR